MPIVISCSTCNTRLTLGDDRAGDRFECPQCDAIIKVPGPAQPPARAVAAGAVAEPPRASRRRDPDLLDLEPDAEPGIDKRVVAGIVAGVAALVLVGVAVVVLAVRKPAETVKREEPASAVGATVNPPTSSPAKGTAEGSPKRPGDTPQKGTAIQTGTPAKGDGPSKGDSPKKGGPPQKSDGLVVVPQYTADFLGSQGKGRRFCIIADNSGSMSGAKLADLKVQLLKTISDVHENAEFYVFFFNTSAEPMPHPTWLKAGAPEMETVKTWVKNTPARGGTQPVPAFTAAFKLDPPPDVIFFMTDGQFANTASARITDLNGTPRKSVVNTIMFAPVPKGGFVPVGPLPGEDNLKRIADLNGGTFTRYAP